MKAQRRKQEADDAQADLASGLNRNPQASGNRAESTGAVSTKTR
jgi:hypothetical protein